MRYVVILALLCLYIGTVASPARADCADKHVDLHLAEESLKQSNAYTEENQDDMMMAAFNEGKHWFDMAENEDCSRHDDDDLEAAMVRAYDPDRRKRAAEDEAEIARQHKKNVAANYAKAHPSKWALSHAQHSSGAVKDNRKSVALSCANPNVEATTTNAAAPNTPPEAQQQGITGVVNVVIRLDAKNQIVGTPVIQSSPSDLLNAAAIEAAEHSTFRAEIKNCQPVATTYIFAVEFNNN